MTGAEVILRAVLIYSTVLYCTLYSTVPKYSYRTSTAVRTTVQYGSTVGIPATSRITTALLSTVQYCTVQTVLYCTGMYCTVYSVQYRTEVPEPYCTGRMSTLV